VLEQLNQSEAKLFSSDAAVYFSTSATATCSIGLDFFTSVFDSLHTGTRVIYRHIAWTVPDCHETQFRQDIFVRSGWQCLLRIMMKFICYKCTMHTVCTKRSVYTGK